MAVIVLNASECDQIELDIIKNVQFNTLIKVKISTNIIENQVFLSTHSELSLIPIRTLINQNYYNLERIKTLLENIITCKTELREHLLRASQIDFNQDHIFYNEALQSYVFLYNPCMNNLTSDLERYLIQDLLIQSNCLNHLDYLTQGSYCLQTLINSLNDRVEKKTFFDTLPFINFKKKPLKETPKPVTKKPTIALTQKGSLISKENHNDIFPLPFSINSIGRGSHCNVYINSPTLSTEHAVISIVQGKYFIKDNLSKNGTFVNDIKIESNTSLSSGNLVKFGEKEFIFIL